VCWSLGLWVRASTGILAPAPLRLVLLPVACVMMRSRGPAGALTIFSSLVWAFAFTGIPAILSDWTGRARPSADAPGVSSFVTPAFRAGTRAS